MSAPEQSPFDAFSKTDTRRPQTTEPTVQRPHTSAGKPKSAQGPRSPKDRKGFVSSPLRPNGMVTPSNVQQLKSQTLGSLPSLRISTAGSRRSPSVGAVAGYKPPAGSAALDPEAETEAKRLLAHPDELMQLLANDVFIFAAKKCGVDADELVPRTVEDFRPAPAVSLRRAQMDLDHYDKMRGHYLGLVLMDLEEAAELMAVRQLEQDELAENKWEGFQSQLEMEQHRLKTIERNRKRIQDVQIRENEKFKTTRQMFEVRQEEFLKRQAEAEEQKRLEEEKIRMKAAKRQRQLEKVRLTKEKRERERVQAILEKEDEREAAKEIARQQAAEEQRRREEEREARRQAREAKREQAKRREEQKKQALLAVMTEKEQRLERIRAEHEQELEAKKDERYIKSKLRAKNAERVRKEKEFKYKMMMSKIAKSYEKMEHLREMRDAIQAERRHQKALEIIRVDEWKAQTQLEKDVTPGPGEYVVPTTIGTQGGGTWGKHKPKSDLEWQMIRAAAVPGPGQYRLKKKDIIPGGTWGNYNAKSDLEWKIYYASQMPGPSDYKPTVDPLGQKGVVFSTTQTPSAIEELIRRKAQEPGPADYSTAQMPVAKPTIKTLREKIDNGKRKMRIMTKLSSIAKSFGTSKMAPMSPIRSDAKEGGSATPKPSVNPQHASGDGTPKETAPQDDSASTLPAIGAAPVAPEPASTAPSAPADETPAATTESSTAAPESSSAPVTQPELQEEATDAASAQAAAPAQAAAEPAAPVKEQPQEQQPQQPDQDKAPEQPEQPEQPQPETESNKPDSVQEPNSEAQSASKVDAKPQANASADGEAQAEQTA